MCASVREDKKIEYYKREREKRAAAQQHTIAARVRAFVPLIRVRVGGRDVHIHAAVKDTATGSCCRGERDGFIVFHITSRSHV